MEAPEILIRAAVEKREILRAAADRQLWGLISGMLAIGRIKQREVAEILGVTRETVRQNVLRYRGGQ
jgi:transcription initiation factor TFIIIB Brf1 subunit/transcription initiation factor TFIIB